MAGKFLLKIKKGLPICLTTTTSNQGLLDKVIYSLSNKNTQKKLNGLIL